MKNFTEFEEGYIDAMFWTEGASLEEEEEKGKGIGYHSLTTETIAEIKADCAKFQDEMQAYLRLSNQSESRHGHDFWLTRNGHGAGFWDGAYSEDIEGGLTNCAERFGEVWPYLGDDSKIYF